MANPTLKWDQMPVYGWWDDEGDILLTVPQRIRRRDGLMIYPGGKTVTVKIGDQTQQDPAARSEVRAALRAQYAASNTMPDDSGPFDGTAWDVWWDGRVNRAIFTYFYLSDDPDVTPNGWQVQVQEKLRSGTGKPYVIQTLSQFLEPGRVPGINLGTIEVPPGVPSIPAPVLAKGQPGGIAALSLNGFPMTASGVELNPATMGGPGGSAIDSWADVQALPGTPTAFPTTSSQVSDFVEAVQDAIGVAFSGGNVVATYNDAAGTISLTAPAGSTFDPELTRDAIGAALIGVGLISVSVNDAGDTITISTTATANSTDAQLRDRATHTGLQSAATISDFTEAVQDAVGAFFGAGTGASVTYNDAANTITVSATGTSDPEAIRDAIGAALVGVGNITVTVNDAGDTITISTTATVNSTDAQLRDRSTHTGTQAQSTVTNLVNDLAAKVPIGAGLYPDYKISYAAAAALSTRPAVPAGASIRIAGGQVSDPDPAWMAVDDYRDVYGA